MPARSFCLRAYGEFFHLRRVASHLSPAPVSSTGVCYAISALCQTVLRVSPETPGVHGDTSHHLASHDFTVGRVVHRDHVRVIGIVRGQRLRILDAAVRPTPSAFDALE